MRDLLVGIRRLNGLGGTSFGEPFAGGAGASLTLLYAEESRRIYINDIDPAIYAFWWSVVNQNKQFLRKIDDVEITIEEWGRQRRVYCQKSRAARDRLGFAAFFLNRCNRSGILAKAGPIGGVQQGGKWKIDARFNREKLRSRCRKVGEYRERILVSCEDAIAFLDRLDKESTMFLIDPPYYHKGSSLYMDTLAESDHALLASRLETMKQAAWVLTYDDCPEVRDMYESWANVRPYQLRYSAYRQRDGKEIMITPKWMQLPRTQRSAGVIW